MKEVQILIMQSDISEDKKIVGGIVIFPIISILLMWMTLGASFALFLITLKMI